MAARIPPAARDIGLGVSQSLNELSKRIHIPSTPTDEPGLVEANHADPWNQSGKYGLGWTYFCLAFLGAVLFVRIWHYWQDKIRQAIYKQEVEQHYQNLYSVDPSWDQSAAINTGAAANHWSILSWL